MLQESAVRPEKSKAASEGQGAGGKDSRWREAEKRHNSAPATPGPAALVPGRLVPSTRLQPLRTTPSKCRRFPHCSARPNPLQTRCSGHPGVETVLSSRFPQIRSRVRRGWAPSRRRASRGETVSGASKRAWNCGRKEKKLKWTLLLLLFVIAGFSFVWDLISCDADSAPLGPSSFCIYNC